jgi:hypothetical protein
MSMRFGEGVATEIDRSTCDANVRRVRRKTLTEYYVRPMQSVENTTSRSLALKKITGHCLINSFTVQLQRCRGYFPAKITLENFHWVQRHWIRQAVVSNTSCVGIW